MSIKTMILGTMRFVPQSKMTMSKTVPHQTYFRNIALSLFILVNTISPKNNLRNSAFRHGRPHIDVNDFHRPRIRVHHCPYHKTQGHDATACSSGDTLCVVQGRIRQTVDRLSYATHLQIML